MNEEALWKRQLELTPNGSQTLSKMPSKYVEGVYPKMLAEGNGPYVKAENGRTYIDYISGLGCISLGYNNELVNNRVLEQVRKGPIFSLPNRLEADASEKLCSLLPWAEQWKFFTSGTEADAAAVKAARAITGRDSVMICGYHGWADWFTISTDKKAGIPTFNEELIRRAKYNDIHSFEALRTRDYACVIMEPMVFDFPHEGFLEAVQALCRETGTLLIWDEVVTGGRFDKLFASNHFQVVPDLITVGKGLANGFHLAAVGAPRSVMSVFERSDFFASGTFGGSCISLAACEATLAQLPTVTPRMVNSGSILAQSFELAFKGYDAKAKGYPTRLSFDFPTTGHKALFWQECAKRGVLFGYSIFVTAAHDAEAIKETVSVMFEAASVVTKAWDDPEKYLEGRLPAEPLRMR